MTISEADLELIRSRWSVRDEILVRLRDEGRHDLAERWRQLFDSGRWLLPLCLLCPGAEEHMSVGRGGWTCPARPERVCERSELRPRCKQLLRVEGGMWWDPGSRTGEGSYLAPAPGLADGWHGYETDERLSLRGDVVRFVELFDGCSRDEAIALIARRLTS